jgi:hypothetical protein
MHEEEWLQAETCALCDAELEPGADCAYYFAEHGVLCFSCALARGGAYDSVGDRWTTPPHVSDLPEAARTGRNP